MAIFRDESAGTTLDGANMVIIDGFDKWAKEERIEPPFAYYAMKGWAQRQPEIDALKDSLHRVINDARNFCQIGLNNWSEIQWLKAENERLRADAKRYQYLRRWVRGETDRYTEQKTIHFFISPVGDAMKGSVAQHLDEAIDAAMKDFSTTEEEK